VNHIDRREDVRFFNMGTIECAITRAKASRRLEMGSTRRASGRKRVSRGMANKIVPMDGGDRAGNRRDVEGSSELTLPVREGRRSRVGD